jgi:hypothetical protein
MIAKANLITPMFLAGAIATGIAAAPIAAADATLARPATVTPATSLFAPTDDGNGPRGGGCVAGVGCGSGGFPGAAGNP